MSDIKLFKLVGGVATELDGQASDLEKPLQTLIENNLEPLLGIRFLASEYATGKTHAGRIDSLGLDENNSPVILEYKRSVGENVINQGLFYLDWLMDHQAEFKLLVMEKLGHAAAALIDWSVPRLLCIAADFTKYDAHAVQQINRNVELIRYRRFGLDLLLLELVNAFSASKPKAISKIVMPVKVDVAVVKEMSSSSDKSYAEWIQQLSAPMLELLTSVEDFIGSLGDDVQRKELKLYVAFKRLKNFASIVPQKSRLVLFLHLNPDMLDPLPANARDARKFGHWGTGDLELSVASFSDFEQTKALILNAYEGHGQTKVPQLI
jgi:predicted transport protein